MTEISSHLRQKLGSEQDLTAKTSTERHSQSALRAYPKGSKKEDDLRRRRAKRRNRRNDRWQHLFG